MYTIKKIENRENWDSFLANAEYTPFLQGSQYIDFSKAEREDAFIVGIYKNEVLIGGAVVSTVHAKRGNFLLLPYGPIFADGELSEDAFKLFMENLTNYAKEHKYDFIRVSPFIDDNEVNTKLFQSAGLKKSPLHVLAEHTWLLDLRQSQEELLKEMKKNHRNLVKRCEREGVTVEIRNDDEAIKIFNDLHDETVKKHGFHRFPRNFVRHEVESLKAKDNVAIFIAKLPDGRVDAAAVIVFYEGMAAYRHGASLGLDKKVPSSYLLQWEAIKEAQRRGCKWYNFWGIAPEGASKKHPFYGISHFKRGFGGEPKNLLPCHDKPISFKYHFTYLLEQFRKIKRGF